MKANHISKALSSDRAVCAVQSRHRDTNDGKGVVHYELVGATLESSKLVKRPTLLGSLLARVGALPVLPPPKPKGRRGPKPKARPVPPGEFCKEGGQS